MDFWASASLLFRRWKFFLPALILALAITGGAYVAVKPAYQAQTTILLVPPKSTFGSQNAVVSPLNNYGSLNTVAAIISEAQTSQAATARLKAKGVASGYTVTPDPTGAVPELIITSSATTPAAALSQDAILTQDTLSYITSIQLSSGAPTRTFVTTQYLGRPVKATKDSKSRLRVVVAVGVVTFFLAVALTFIFDSVMNKREEPAPRRRATDVGQDPPAPRDPALPPNDASSIGTDDAGVLVVGATPAAVDSSNGSGEYRRVDEVAPQADGGASKRERAQELADAAGARGSEHTGARQGAELGSEAGGGAVEG